MANICKSLWRPPLDFEAGNFGPTVSIENFIIVYQKTPRILTYAQARTLP